MTTISVPKDTISFPETATDKKGAWMATEWDKDVYVMMTKLGENDVYDEKTSAVYSTQTYYYNSLEAKDGNIAGRVPVDPGTQWRVLMLNYDSEEEKSMTIVYGGAVHSMLTYTGLALSLAFTAFAF